MKKISFLQLQILTIVSLFFVIVGCSSIIYAQDSPSNAEPEMSGADYYEVSENNVVYNFNELPPYYAYNYLQYQYARFSPFPYGQLRTYNEVGQGYYPNFISNPYPADFFGGINVEFFQPVRNLSFSTVGVDGGNFKVDIYRLN